MAWQIVAQGASLQEFQAYQPPIADLPKGTKLLFRVELPWWAPVGWLADLFTAEWFARRLTPEGVIVDDVSGGWHWIEVKATVDPPWLTAVAIIVFGLLLLAMGIASIIALVTLNADIPAMVKWGSTAVIALAIFGIAYVLTRGRQSGKQAAPT